MALQKRLAPRILLKDDFGRIQTVAGADVAVLDRDRTSGLGIAGVVLFDFETLEELERVSATAPLPFPYIPGLLSFREGPVLLKAFQKLSRRPDLILFDGQGIAHPRRFGIASHMGLLLDRPSIGCAKSLLCGHYQEPGLRRGDWVPLRVRRESGLAGLRSGGSGGAGGPPDWETIGAILRSRDRVRPIFISPGHRISLRTALEFTLRCSDGFRIPKPTRIADQFVSNLKKS